MIKGKCRIHGVLDEETGFRYVSKTSESGYRLKCRKCFEERTQGYSEANIGKPKPEDIKGFCRKHGELNFDTGIICYDKKLPIGYRIRCKECVHTVRANNYYNNREKNISKAQEWKKNNRDRINEQVREDRKIDPEKYKRWSNKYKEKNRDKMSLNQSLRARNFSKERFDKMMLEQNGKCKICKQAETRMARDGKTITRLCIDHDHDSNEVRALLCHDCNTALGKMKDCPELLIEAAYYLVDYKGWTE